MHILVADIYQLFYMVGNPSFRLSRRLLLPPSFWLLSLLLAPLTVTAQSRTRPERINIGIYLKHLRIDENSGRFESIAYYWLKVQRKDNKPIEYYDSITSLEFTNGINETDSILERKWVENGKYFYKTGKIKGTFSFTADLEKYPLDIQVIPFIIESRLSTVGELEFLEDPETKPNGSAGVFYDTSINMQGREISGARVRIDSSKYNTNFGDPDKGQREYSRYTAEYIVKRPESSFWIKIVVPNLFLLIIAYLVFFIPARELEVAVGCTVTSLLASIALKWSIDNSLPSVPYTTSADRLFYLFYFLITAALVESVITYNLNKKKEYKLERTIEMGFQIGYPIILFFGITAIMWRG